MLSNNGYTYGYVEHPSTIRRLADFPADESSCFDTLAKAKDYAKNNPIAYDTQIIGVKETQENYQIQNKTLIPLKVSSIEDLYKCFGYWCSTNLIDGTGAKLDFDLVYPLDVDGYKVYIDDNAVSNVLNLSDEFISASSLFENDINMTIKLYKQNELSFDEVLTLYIVPTFKNNNLTCGILTAHKNLLK